MRKENIEIGKIYQVKVSGKLVKVRVTANHSNGGYIGTNLATNRQIRIKTAARLRSLFEKDNKQ